MTPVIKPEQLLQELCRRDTRYPHQAYAFLYDSLGYVQNELVKQGLLPARKPEELARREPSEEPSQHVTGQQLAMGCRDFALQEYGMMAAVVLKSWNITQTSDIGEMVYNLIDIGLMSKTETDRREDFDRVYDMQKAFADGFQFQFV